MTIRRWVALLGVALCVLGARTLSGCAMQKVAVPVASNAPSGAQIPVDLDVVLRIDVGRVRSELGPEWVRQLRQMSGESSADRALLLAVLSLSDVVWLGLRPAPSPSQWDYVLIFEGDFDDLKEDVLGKVLKPRRPLGGDIVVRDAWSAPTRLSLGRLYAFGTEKLLLASAAEVDAVERVVEQGRLERGPVPPARGLASFSIKGTRALSEWALRAPRLLRGLSHASEAHGFVDFTGQGVRLELRVHFPKPDSADEVARGLKLVLDQVLHSDESIEWKVEPVDSDLTLSLLVQHERLARWLGMR